MPYAVLGFVTVKKEGGGGDAWYLCTERIMKLCFREESGREYESDQEGYIFQATMSPWPCQYLKLGQMLVLKVAEVVSEELAGEKPTGTIDDSENLSHLSAL